MSVIYPVKGKFIKLHFKTEFISQTVQKGDLGKALEAEVMSVSVQLPEIPPADQRSNYNSDF